MLREFRIISSKLIRIIRRKQTKEKGLDWETTITMKNGLEKGQSYEFLIRQNIDENFRSQKEIS